MTENNAAKAVQEAERIAAADEYFKARAWLMDTNDNRRVFEAGFDRAYALLSKLRAEGVQAGEPVAYSWEGSTTPRMLFRSAQRAAQWVQANGGKLTPLYAALASAPAAGAALPDVLPEMTTEGGAQYVSMATVQTVLRAARATLQSAAVDPEAEKVDFLVRVFAELDTWRAEDWNELIERRPAILALLRPLVMASASVADRQRLRELVDVVWSEATESTAVPDTPWADRLIDKVFPSLAASAPVAGEVQPVAWRTVWTEPTPGSTAWRDAREVAPPDAAKLNARGYSLELAYAAPHASEAVRNAEPVAYCQPDDPINSSAFSWPGMGRKKAHTTPLYAGPQADKHGGDCAKGAGDRLMAAAKGMTKLYPHVWDRTDGALVVFPENVARFDAAFDALRVAVGEAVEDDDHAALSPTQPTEQGERDA